MNKTKFDSIISAMTGKKVTTDFDGNDCVVSFEYSESYCATSCVRMPDDWVNLNEHFLAGFIIGQVITVVDVVS